MSLFNRLISRENPSVEKRALHSSVFVPPPGAGVADDYVGIGNAMANMAVYGCIRILADTIAGLPWKVYRRDGNGVPVEVNPQPDIIREPCPGFDLYQWKWMTVASLALRGNSFHMVTERDNREYPIALTPLHPDAVFLERRPDMLRWFDPIYRVLGEVVPSPDMIHMRRFTMPGDPWGLSPIRQAAQAIGIALAANEYGYRFFKESANPTGVLSTDQSLDEETIKRQQQTWISSHQGRRLPAILTGGFKWTPLSIAPEESQFLSVKQFQRSEIYMLYGVPPHILGDTEKNTCLPADAQVFTEDGPRRIADVRVGDRVWSLDESSKSFRLARVWRSEATGVDPILEIKAKSRTLRANARHRVLVRRAKKDGGETLWLPAGEIKVGDYIIAANGLPDGKVQSAPNGRLLSEGFMAFLGLYLGDGCKGPGHVSIARHIDAPYMDYYRQVMVDEFVKSSQDSTSHGYGGYKRGCRCDACVEAKRSYSSIWKKARKEGSPTTGIVFNGGSDQWQSNAPVTLREYERNTAFSSQLAVTELCELGMDGTSHTKRVPEWVFHLSPDLIAAFLAGYIDSDGAVNTRGWITFSSCNPDLLTDIAHLCMLIGVPTGTVRRYSQAGDVVIAGRDVKRGDMYQLFAYNVESNRKISPHHPEKRRRLADAPVPKPRSEEFFPGGSLKRVDSISELPAETVYDLGVEGTHTFIADGVVVHNSWGSGISSLSLGFVTYTLRAWTSCIESVISNVLPPGQFVRFDFTELLRGDIEKRYESYAKALQSSWMSPNEIRAEEELPPIDGGDIYLQPTTMAPLGYSPPKAANVESDSEGPKPSAKPQSSYPLKPVSGGENARQNGSSFFSRVNDQDL